MESMFDDLINLLQSAESYSNCHSHKQALDIYAQIIDTYLSRHSESLIILFDQTIAELLPQLDILLVEASSLMISEPPQPSDLASISDPPTANVAQRPFRVTMSPLLTPEVRCGWIKRLFVLWLKYRDRPQVSEQLQEILFEVAWREDISFLHTLIESELHLLSSTNHVHVDDCAKESQTSALKKFLKQLLQ